MSGALNAASFRWDDTRYAASDTLRSYLRSILLHKEWNSELKVRLLANVRIGSWLCKNDFGSPSSARLNHCRKYRKSRATSGVTPTAALRRRPCATHLTSRAPCLSAFVAMMSAPASHEDRAAAGGYGPWRPGLESGLPRELLPLATVFRRENVSTSV